MEALLGGLDEEHRALAEMMIKEGQQHIFEGWSPGSATSPAAVEFFEQIRMLDSKYPGGLPAYLSKARQLLKGSSAAENPFKGCVPSVPDGVKLEFASDDFVEAETLGVACVKDCAFVLVAGGLGERLGFRGLKVALPAEITTNMSFMELYCQQILSLQRQSNALHGTDTDIPLVLMTSDDTHDRTRELFERCGHFGLKASQVILLKQEKVAALADVEARLAVDPTNPYRILTKPHGHGDVHTLLQSSGLVRAWHEQGKKFIVFFQDTNSLTFTVSTAALGISFRENLEINSVCLPRKAGEAVGVIAVLSRDDGWKITGNVEYNQLDPMLRSVDGIGDVNDPVTDFSPYPGNTNILIYAVDPYLKILDRTGGLVPEFVNPKYADASRTTFTAPTRLECMMQDHSQMVEQGAKVQYTQFPQWIYMPCKNSIASGRAKAKLGLPPQCASASEMSLYETGCRYLRAAGVAVPESSTWEVTGFSVAMCPRVVLKPSFATTVAEVVSKFPSPRNVEVSMTSTLVLDGQDIMVEALSLDGALVVNAAPGARVVIRHLDVRNAGWIFEKLEDLADGGESEPEEIQIRGYRLNKIATLELVFPIPGTYVVDDRLT